MTSSFHRCNGLTAYRGTEQGIVGVIDALRVLGASRGYDLCNNLLNGAYVSTKWDRLNVANLLFKQ